MRLDEKVAVVYGAGGPMGGAVARAFAEAGAKLYLAGRDSARLAPLADEISASAATVDVDDRSAVEQHADAVLAAAGRLDISFNVAATDDVQGMPLTDMSTEDFMQPIEQAARRNFHTMTAAARRMVARRSGAIVTLTSSAGREWRHQMGGFSVA
jgi:3-oxoacyl-[acyl-carrier protein] reductase